MYPAEGKVTHPDDVGERRMPSRQTKVAGDVVKGPWSLERSDVNRLANRKGLQQYDEDAGKWKNINADVIPMKEEFK